MLSKNLEQRNDSIQKYNQKGPFQPILGTFRHHSGQNDFSCVYVLGDAQRKILRDTGPLMCP